MSVIGIDLGTSGIYVGNINDGSVSMFVGETGSRNTPTFITYGEKKRIFGKESKTFCLKEPKLVNTIHSMKRFIGMKYSELDKMETCYLPLCKIIQGKNDEILFEVKHLGKTEYQTPQQALGSIFGLISRDYNKTLKRKGKIDAVIAVPPYFTDRRRRAVADAARIGGMNPIQIMTDISAVSVLRGIRLDLKDNEKETIFVIDIGASHSTVAMVEFTNKESNVMCFKCEPNFGARVFEKLLYDFFLKYLKDTYELDANTNLRARLKLYGACEKIKQNLSQNTSVSYYLECFMNDRDVQLKITRDQLLKIADSHLSSFKKMLTSFIHENGIDIKKVDKIELIGGGSYIPYVKKIVEDTYAGKKCWTTLNAVESVAQGCSLQGAIISPAYNIKKALKLYESFPTSVKLGWWSESQKKKDEGWNKTANLFKKGSKFPVEKDVSFKRDQDFEIILMYDSVESFQTKQPKKLGSFQIKKVPKEKKEVTIRVGMDDSGMVDVKSAWYKYDKEIEEKVEIKEKKEKKKEKKKDKKKDTKGKKKPKRGEKMGREKKKEKQESKKGEAETENIQEENKEKETEVQDNKNEEKDVEMQDKPEEKTSTKPNETKDNKEELKVPKKDDTKKGEKTKKKDEKKVEKKEKKYKIVKKTVTFTEYLEVSKDLPQLSQRQLVAFKGLEEKFVKVDKLEEETAMVRDNIEREGYEILDKILEGELLHDFIVPEDIEKVEQTMQDAIDWVYGEGENVTKEVYVKKYNELLNFMAPVKRRCAEYIGREKMLTVLTENLQKYDDFHESKDEKYNHINAEEREKVKNKVHETRLWLAKELAEQSKLKKYVDPVLTISIITEKSNDLVKFCQPIMNKLKPKPKKVEKKKDDKGKKEKKGKESGKENGEKKDSGKKENEGREERKEEGKEKGKDEDGDVKMEDKPNNDEKKDK